MVAGDDRAVARCATEAGGRAEAGRPAFARRRRSSRTAEHSAYAVATSELCILELHKSFELHKLGARSQVLNDDVLNDDVLNGDVLSVGGGRRGAGAEAFQEST